MTMGMGMSGNSHSHSHYSREYWEWEWKFQPRHYSHRSREFWEWEWVFVGIPNSQKIPKFFFNVIVSVFKSYIYKRYRRSGFLLTVSVWKFKISTNRPREPPGLQPISGFNWKIRESDISWFTESNGNIPMGMSGNGNGNFFGNFAIFPKIWEFWEWEWNPWEWEFPRFGHLWSTDHFYIFFSAIVWRLP